MLAAPQSPPSLARVLPHPPHERNLQLLTPVATPSSTPIPASSPTVPLCIPKDPPTLPAFAQTPTHAYRLPEHKHIPRKRIVDTSVASSSTASSSESTDAQAKPEAQGKVLERRETKGTSEKSVEVDPVDRILATQLAHLASQHQSSEYSTSKLIHRQVINIPPYVPISIQNPSYVQGLRRRQAELAQRQCWFISDDASASSVSSNADGFPVQEQNMGGKVEDEGTIVEVTTDVTMEIQAAIEEQMPPAPANGTKTSATHPIHISSIVPMSSIPLITLFLSPSEATSSCLFTLPDHWRLHRLIGNPFNPNNHHEQTHSHSDTTAATPQPSVWPKPPVMWSQPGSSELLRNALSTDLASNAQSWKPYSNPKNGMPLFPPPTPPSQPRTPVPPSPPSLKRFARRQPRRDMTRSRALSAPPTINAQKIVRRPATFKELRPRSSVSGMGRVKSHPEVPRPSLAPAALFIPTVVDVESQMEVENSEDAQPDLSAPRLQQIQSDNTNVQCSAASTDADTHLPTVDPQSNLRTTTPLQRLGNFFLSSCPGKKVRLQGPVKGRGTICRDVKADLARVRELGVKCIICCLDDSELDFLGASWSEYWAVANSLGMSVFRIPIPEGLPPLSPQHLDSNLTRIMEEYTLKGIPVLAHCRGGVGRAGLIACCWMLKLGLCGWRDSGVCERMCDAGCRERAKAFAAGINTTPTPAPRVCRATLQLVESAIGVLRQRRSLKAIETYEQVRFLVDFVEYLENSHSRPPSSPSNSSVEIVG